MADHDFQVKISKSGNLVIVNPADNTTLTSVRFAGGIDKGCKTPTDQFTRTAAFDGGVQRMRAFDTVFSFGHFSSPVVPGAISMQQNPKFPDSGYEIEEVPGQDYPRTQYWNMYAIFTMDLSNLDPKLALFQVANRFEHPIKLKTRLDEPWGTKSIRYELLVDKIPLFPWDGAEFNFASVCPFTGGELAPVAYIDREADQTDMVAAWRRVDGQLTKTF